MASYFHHLQPDSWGSTTRCYLCSIFSTPLSRRLLPQDKATHYSFLTNVISGARHDRSRRRLRTCGGATQRPVRTTGRAWRRTPRKNVGAVGLVERCRIACRQGALRQDAAGPRERPSTGGVGRCLRVGDGRRRCRRQLRASKLVAGEERCGVRQPSLVDRSDTATSRRREHVPGPEIVRSQFAEPIALAGGWRDVSGHGRVDAAPSAEKPTAAVRGGSGRHAGWRTQSPTSHQQRSLSVVAQALAARRLGIGRRPGGRGLRVVGGCQVLAGLGRRRGQRRTNAAAHRGTAGVVLLRRRRSSGGLGSRSLLPLTGVARRRRRSLHLALEELVWRQLAGRVGRQCRKCPSCRRTALETRPSQRVERRSRDAVSYCFRRERHVTTTSGCCCRRHRKSTAAISVVVVVAQSVVDVGARHRTVIVATHDNQSSQIYLSETQIQ